jgi:hypothetical protein
VIWTSDEFGARRVGRIHLAGEHDGGERWTWAVNPPMPIPTWCHGITKSRDAAMAAFRRSFERFHADTSTRQWVDAFATQRASAERLERHR